MFCSSEKLKVPRSDQIPEQGVLANMSKNFALPLSGGPCIADSLPHVETNQQVPK